MDAIQGKEEFELGGTNLIDGGMYSKELFDESDLSDMENMNLAEFDNHGKPVSPKLPTPFEELHCVEYDKFFVPLFEDCQGMVLRGNGVIVGPYLITAAHVAQKPKGQRYLINTSRISTLYYLFDNQYYNVADVAGQLVYDGRGYIYSSENHDDLIVYQLNNISSPLVLSNEPIQVDMEFGIKSFHLTKSGKLLSHSSVRRTKELTAACNNQIWKNCFRVYNPNEWFSPGDSGSALFIKNKVYGILLMASQDGQGKIGTVLKASYIKERIESLKSK